MKFLWENQVRGLPLLEGEWEKPSTSDAGDAVDERTTLRKSGAQPAVMESPPRSSDTHGRLRA